MPELKWEVHDGQTDYLFSRHMSVLRSGNPDDVESKYDRNRARHRAAVNAVCNLRASPRDVGRQRDRAWANPRIRGNAAFLGAQTITLSSLRVNGGDSIDFACVAGAARLYSGGKGGASTIATETPDLETARRGK
jgi:hypothetical protein